MTTTNVQLFIMHAKKVAPYNLLLITQQRFSYFDTFYMSVERSY